MNSPVTINTLFPAHSNPGGQDGKLIPLINKTMKFLVISMLKDPRNNFSKKETQLYKQ